MSLQHTIDHDVLMEGRGLFTGVPVHLRFRPAPPRSGICFVRIDQQPSVTIRAHVDNVVDRPRRTVLANGSASVETVEHCLSACAALQIDNLIVELDAGELPGMDGSSLPFVTRLSEAGLMAQEVPRERFYVRDVVRVVEDDGELIALPPIDHSNQWLEIAYDLDYGPTGPIGRQTYRLSLTPEVFAKEIAPARTFCLKDEADRMRAGGMGAHLGYGDILVFGPEGPIDNELRFPDECVRHKILDLIGDLALMGRAIVGRIFARKSGHALNHALVRALIENEAGELPLRTACEPVLDIRQIQRILPHRYPFLLVDRIVALEGSRRIVAIKNVTVNEHFFQGHYPGDPIMPGVLILEAMAQAGGILLSQELEHKGKVAVLLTMDKVKFRRAVRPGDQLMLDVKTLRVRSSTGHILGVASVSGYTAAEAEIKFHLTDADR